MNKDQPLLFTGLILLVNGMAIAILVGMPITTKATSDAEKPVRLHADTIKIDEKQKRSIYQGEVRLTQGKLIIRASRIIAEGKQIKPDLITAQGKPLSVSHVINSQKVNLTAQTARYDIANASLDLATDVVIERDGETVRGSALHYNMNTGEITLQGDDQTRVHALIRPSAVASNTGAK
ncbi:MAG: lipopolysaccharide transport periplasmic protein LptA [Gammaproteobacteria bacterium]|nr:lipopolysaccharide transport periplasmic protein LptA [Gammaproteobacteria bacterium]